MSSKVRREQVVLACERGLSKRRACELIEIARSGLRYRSVRAERDRPSLQAMKRLAAQYLRYGYRRIRVFLRREGHPMSRHRAHRLWRLAGLQLPRRRPRRPGRVIEGLSPLMSQHGTLRCLRSDNGSELVSRAILEWLAAARVATVLIDPCKPWQNGADESFNGKFRDECQSL